MRPIHPLALVPFLLLPVACGDDGAPPADAGHEAGMDAGMDAGTDAATDVGMDAATDAATDATTDGGGDSSTGDGGAPALQCNPDAGIECDGDWSGACTPACAADECCAPVGGQFSCVTKVDGACPAADLWVDAERITGQTSVDWVYFPDDDCAVVEACVGAPGWRRLLRFGTWTPNTGTADMYLGLPNVSNPNFEYSACHEHVHFKTYARYDLRDPDGASVADGHKQAFCLLDFYQYPGENDTGAVYNCTNQGIQAGWQDVYGAGLDCQWVDVTDVEPGDYQLHIELNYRQLLLELDYTNNVTDVMVTVPLDDPNVNVTEPCPAGTPAGVNRDCGLERLGLDACTPGTDVTLGCSTECGLGTCTGDPFLRVCGQADDPNCLARVAIAANDDAGCGAGTCPGTGCCPQVTFPCPADGKYVVFTGSWDPTRSSTCAAAANP